MLKVIEHLYLMTKDKILLASRSGIFGLEAIGTWLGKYTELVGEMKAKRFDYEGKQLLVFRYPKESESMGHTV